MAPFKSYFHQSGIVLDMRDDFTEEIKRIVAGRVGFCCSNPECRATTTGPQDDPSKLINVGVAAHITAASPGGPRYDQALSPEERGSVNNAIWLCQTCAKLVDNDQSRFTEEVLKLWKSLAEAETRSQVGKPAPAAEQKRIWVEGDKRDLLEQCTKVIQSSDSWQLVSTKYSVAYKPPDPNWPWKEGVLDLRAIYGGYQGWSKPRRHLTLLIECENSSPDVAEWFFFPAGLLMRAFFPWLETKSAQTHINNPEIRARLLPTSLDLPLSGEVRITYGNAATAPDNTLADATYQVALATQAIMDEEIKHGEYYGRFNPEEEELVDKHVFLPTVVTSAKLFVGKFGVGMIDPATDRIPYDLTKLLSVPYLIYRVPLPAHLQRRPEPSIVDTIMYGSHVVHTRMDILIVNSDEFSNFLRAIPELMSYFW